MPFGGGRPVDPLDGVLKQLRKIVTPDGRQLYSIEDDQEALSELLSQWFNVTRKLYEHELGLWEQKGPQIECLLEDYNEAIGKLKETDGKMYSGVGLNSRSILLIPTKKQEKAEDRADLIGQVEEHMQAHKPQIDAYQSVKPILPTLKAGLQWLNEALDYVKKNGRIT